MGLLIMGLLKYFGLFYATLSHDGTTNYGTFQTVP